MTNDRERTACCGLYCGDCIPANDSFFESAERLRQLLEETRFEEYARYKSVKNNAFESCELLEPLCACHGDTHRHNLRMVKQYGVDNWSHKRGTHYRWQKPCG